MSKARNFLCLHLNALSSEILSFRSFLAHGKSVMYHSLVERIGLSTIYNLIPEVCLAIVETLQPEYVRFPDTADWEAIAEGMFDAFGLPNCLGAIDGKHIRIFAPPHSGSLHYNYKKYNSVILMGVAESTRRIPWATVGVPGQFFIDQMLKKEIMHSVFPNPLYVLGSQNDATVFNYSDLGIRLNNGNANLPADRVIPGTNIEVPYYFLGDGGFPLKHRIMTPYVIGPRLAYSEKRFNKKLSGARQVVECAFGILANKWKILQQPMNFKLETTNIIIMALVCLHNFIITQQMSSGNQSYTTIDRTPGEELRRFDNLYPEDLISEEQNDADGLEIRRKLTLYTSMRY